MKKAATLVMGIVVFAFFISGAVLFLLRPWDRPRTAYSSGDTGDFPSDRFEPVPVIEDELTPFEKINPLHRATRAEKLLSNLPAGTEVYEFEVDEPSTGRIWRSPEGNVFVDRNGAITEITAYRKPEPTAGFEFRPAVIGYAGAGAGPGLAIDIVRVGKFHAGPAAAYDAVRGTASAGASVSYNTWQNVDVGIYAGKRLGRDGWSGGFCVGLAVQ
ncbi:MAG: hypothetical protein JSW52_01790 [Candidatus Coatesbacteria bacterium]|nr:MAG: hypothetical protein JSW52_01790 [Candidatus Coatesbacteria bacterium]